MVSPITGQKVLVFGSKVYGFLAAKEISTKFSEITLAGSLNQIDRLNIYSLVILDYSTFLIEGKHHYGDQEIFTKLIYDALSTGTSVCFVHYNEEVPEYDKYNYDNGLMDKEDFERLRNLQIGFSFLAKTEIRPLHSDVLIPQVNTNRSEFEIFNKRWGASHNVFSSYGENGFADLICGRDNYSISFSIDALNGKILYVPFQRDHERSSDLKRGLIELVEACIAYLTKVRTSLPEWAASPIFPEEIELVQKKAELTAEVEAIDKGLAVFDRAKTLLFLSEYDLEDQVPKFISSDIGLLTYREEKFKEDFWLVGEDEEKIAICEIKSLLGPPKKGTPYSIVNHRDDYGLEDSFPALLFINSNLKANSFKEKDRLIEKSIIEFAHSNNILILRIEDLVRIWYSLRNNQLTKDHLTHLWTKNKGWLELNDELAITIH
jgi:hypothetical protein